MIMSTSIHSPAFTVACGTGVSSAESVTDGPAAPKTFADPSKVKILSPPSIGEVVVPFVPPSANTSSPSSKSALNEIRNRPDAIGLSSARVKPQFLFCPLPFAPELVKEMPFSPSDVPNVVTAWVVVSHAEASSQPSSRWIAVQASSG